MPSHDSTTFSVVRLTEREDMTTDSGFRFAQSAVNNAKDDNMVLFGQLFPVLVGPMAEHQQTFPGGEEGIQGHLMMFKALWKTRVNFVDWLKSIRKKRGLCVERPKNCSYWNWKDVRSFLSKWNLQYICFDGCAIGLRARSGEPLKKPWRICSNYQTFLLLFVV